MDTLIIRDLPDGLKTRLRLRAAEHNRTIEAEAREILRQAVGEPEDKAAETPTKGLATRIRERIAPLGGVELEIPPREPMPELDESVRRLIDEWSEEAEETPSEASPPGSARS